MKWTRIAWEAGGSMSESVAPARNRAWVWPTIGLVMAAVILLSAYVVIRFASSPIGTVLPLLALLLIGLTTLGYHGAKRGYAAPFAAIALILPYLLVGVIAYASAQSVAAEFGDVMSDLSDLTSMSEETTAPDESGDENMDGIPDDSYVGTDCSVDFEGDPPAYGECNANGGDAGSGPTAENGEPPVKDKNQDGIPDNEMSGRDCEKVYDPNDELAFALCMDNGGHQGGH